METSATCNNTHRHGALWLCLLLSVLIHGIMAVVLVWSLNHPQRREHKRSKGPRYSVVLSKTPAPDTPANNQENTSPDEQKPFIKTNPDRPQQHPDDADFEGQRDARAEGMNTDSQRSDTPIPTMEGEEKEEINTLQQERQDGDIAYYGKIDEPAHPTQPTQEAPQPTPHAPRPAPGIPEATPTQAPDIGTSSSDNEASISQAPPSENSEDNLKVRTPEEEAENTEETQQELPAPQPGVPENDGTATTPSLPAVEVRLPVYDPTQADHAQPPGLRTTERRTRSTGQFVIGKLPSCNVEATPRGQYEELVYRLIARQWYFACDNHRGDIIPGTVIIALRINTRGRVESMNLVNRRGASVSQQSFTFAAIRRAQFPAMPKEVQKTLIGNLMELIITFDFN